MANPSARAKRPRCQSRTADRDDGGPRSGCGVSETRSPDWEIATRTRGVGNREAGLQDVSLSVRQGEILGIAGLVGSGRTQLAEIVFGLTPADSGEIVVDGATVRIESPASRDRAWNRLRSGRSPAARSRARSADCRQYYAEQSRCRFRSTGLIDSSAERKLGAAVCGSAAGENASWMRRQERFPAAINRKWRWPAGLRRSRKC